MTSGPIRGRRGIRGPNRSFHQFFYVMVTEIAGCHCRLARQCVCGNAKQFMKRNGAFTVGSPVHGRERSAAFHRIRDYL